MGSWLRAVGSQWARGWSRCRVAVGSWLRAVGSRLVRHVWGQRQQVREAKRHQVLHALEQLLLHAVHEPHDHRRTCAPHAPREGWAAGTTLAAAHMAT